MIYQGKFVENVRFSLKTYVLVRMVFDIDLSSFGDKIVKK